MESIRDLSWMAQIVASETLERFELSGYSVVSILVPSRSGQQGATYRYRMLFSEKGDNRPVYAINLETSILGEWLITEQKGTEHHIVHRLTEIPSYDRFRVLALDRAVTRLEKKD